MARALSATGDRWTLMIVLALAPGRTRLTHLHRRLPTVSTSVLEHHLQRMAAADLITRTRTEISPPRVELELTDAGRELLAVSGMLARWGMRNRWSEPVDTERIDIGAFLRMLPTLLEERPGLPDGTTLQATVASTYALTAVSYHVENGQLEIDAVVEEEEPDVSSLAFNPAGTLDGHPRHSSGAPRPPTACVWGDEQAWIAALGPAVDYRHLHFDGTAKFAKQMLDGLPRRRTISP
ncbi:MAG TPA: helix-turn-helix domain-containing protein [Solirubrobacteraceae bacterium]|jgi:DNA-binding HxlR family transcriptional regulator|nr:helix-turn-helix domain-containing protein [Solirubrobacteraceae bacterium]